MFKISVLFCFFVALTQCLEEKQHDHEYPYQNIGLFTLNGYLPYILNRNVNQPEVASASSSGFSYPIVSPSSIGCGSDKQCMMRYIFTSRLFVVMPDPFDRVSVYLAEEGLSSVFKDPTYNQLHRYVSSPSPKSALLVSPNTVYSTNILNKNMEKIVLPSNFKLSDLEILAKISDRIPFLYITDKADLSGLNLPGVNHFANFNFFNGNINPVVPNTFPSLAIQK